MASKFFVMAGLVVIGFFFFYGCSQESALKEADTNNQTEANQAKTLTESESTPEHLLSPPALIVRIGEETIQPIRGSYSWSINFSDGTGQGIETESDSPATTLKGYTPLEVSADAEIELDFETAPRTYEVRVWNPNSTLKSSSRKFNLEVQQGIVFYEILARWDEGTVSYTFALDVRK